MDINEDDDPIIIELYAQQFNWKARYAGTDNVLGKANVRFLQDLGSLYRRDLFNRMRFSYEQDGQVYTVSRDEFEAEYAAGKINDETTVFDPLVKNLGELKAQFKKPLKDSWHARSVG